jgi:hypothetical protein
LPVNNYFKTAPKVSVLPVSDLCAIAISVVNSFHPSAQQRQAGYMNVELDAEKRLQALVAKDGIRIKEFFLDFDKLRKGTVGEAAVSTPPFVLMISFSSVLAWVPST